MGIPAFSSLPLLIVIAPLNPPRIDRRTAADFLGDVHQELRWLFMGFSGGFGFRGSSTAPLYYPEKFPLEGLFGEHFAKVRVQGR